MNKVKKSTLSDYVSLQRGTTYKSRLLGFPGPVLLGLASIGRDGGFRSDSLKTYGGESPDKLILKPGDLYVSLKDVTQSGDLLGSVSRVPSWINSGRLTQDTVKLSFISNDIPADYVYWLLRTPQYREYCRSRAMGTTNLSLSRDDFLAFPVPLPTRGHALLVETLQALDDKIELNRKMNESFEAMARAIFKAWFVDFAPVVAKSEGRQPEGMEAETAKLFPDSFEASEIGRIPKGWKVFGLDGIANYLNGLALQKYPAEGDESLPVIKIAQLRTGNTDGADRASTSVPAAYIVQDGDVLFSWSGSLTVVLWCGGIGALNQHLFKVTSKHFQKWFFYLWTQRHLPEFQSIAADKATTMGHIQRHHLSAAKVVVPPPKLLDAIGQHIAPLVDATIRHRIECRTLAAIRDALLPRLLSGELSVSTPLEA